MLNDTIKDSNIMKRTIYFWKLWNDIDKVQQEEIGKFKFTNLYLFSYLGLFDSS